MMQQNAFITPYKASFMYKNDNNNGKCIYCDKYATQKHLLGGCEKIKNELIERHDIVVKEIYKKLIETKLSNKYDYNNKWIKL